MAGSLTLTGLSAGLAAGEKIIGPNTMTGGQAIGQITDATLVMGDNIFLVPALAVAVAVFLPATNTAAISIRSNLNPLDAGFPINPTGPWFALPLVVGTTEIILNANAAGATVELSFI